MGRWNINKKELTKIILKTTIWATDNHYLRESLVTDDDIQYAIEQRKIIIE